MDLWIRSQNKEILIKCNDIAIKDNGIVGYFDKEKEYEDLGVYKTKNRALEVLDEIQKCMLKGSFAKITNGLGQEIDFIPNPIFIYQMPEE